MPSDYDQKLFAFESFDDSLRRFQRLCEIRKDLRTKYDNHPQQAEMKETQHSVNIPIEKLPSSQSVDPNIVQLYDQIATNAKIRDRRFRSRTLEANQIRTADNQTYGCSSSKTKQQAHHRSESHKNRSYRLSFRRSSEDFQDKTLHLRRHLNLENANSNETWFEVEREHWANLLENGWRPTVDTLGVNLVSFADSGIIKLPLLRINLNVFCFIVDNQRSRRRNKNHRETAVIDLYEQITRNEYVLLFERLDFAYARTIDLGNEFWRFLEINGSQHLCLYHQLNKQFIMYKPDTSLLSLPWPYDGIVDVSWSKSTNTWAVATQTQIVNLFVISINCKIHLFIC